MGTLSSIDSDIADGKAAMQPLRAGPPHPKLSGGRANKPQAAIIDGHFRITYRGFRPSIGMRMIMPHDPQTGLPRGLVCGDQNGGIDLETSRRVLCHIGRNANVTHFSALPQQQPANLMAWAGFGLVQNPLQQGS